MFTDLPTKSGGLEPFCLSVGKRHSSCGTGTEGSDDFYSLMTLLLAKAPTCNQHSRVAGNFSAGTKTKPDPCILMT